VRELGRHEEASALEDWADRSLLNRTLQVRIGGVRGTDNRSKWYDDRNKRFEYSEQAVRILGIRGTK
jgi:hypothetical protein